MTEMDKWPQALGSMLPRLNPLFLLFFTFEKHQHPREMVHWAQEVETGSEERQKLVDVTFASYRTELDSRPVRGSPLDCIAPSQWLS